MLQISKYIYLTKLKKKAPISRGFFLPVT